MATWYRGLNFKNASNTTIIGGIGVAGDTNVEKAYIGLGNEPWKNTGLEIIPNKTKVFGKLEVTQDLEVTGSGRNFIAPNNYGYMGRTTTGTVDYLLWMNTGNQVNLGYNNRQVKIDCVNPIQRNGHKLYHAGNSVTLEPDFENSFRTITKGDVSPGAYLATARTNTDGIDIAPKHSAALTFGISDTHSYMNIAYSFPKVVVGGGNQDKLNWTKELSFADHNHDSIYLGKTEKAESAKDANTVNGRTVLTSVPTGAVFTDTNTWRGVQDNLTSNSAELSLSANQGRLLKDMVDKRIEVKSQVTDIDTATGHNIFVHKPSSPVGWPSQSGSHNGMGVISLHTHSGNYYSQLAMSSADNKMFIRSRSAGDYGAWQQVYTTQHKPSIADIGAASADHTHSYLPLSGGTLTGDLTVNRNIIIGTAGYNFVAPNNYGYMGRDTNGTNNYMLWMNTSNQINLGHNNRQIKIDCDNPIQKDGHKMYHEGFKQTAKDNEKRFTVNGEANKYYPVLISSGYSGFGENTINISRGYNWRAPDSWNNATHKGGLTLAIKAVGCGSWSGNSADFHVSAFNESYTTVCGGLEMTVNGLIVWLRGGVADYEIRTGYGQRASATVHLNGYTAGDNKVYAVKTSPDTNQVRTRFVNRNGFLYDNNNRVYSASNRPTASDVGAAASSHNHTSLTSVSTIGGNGGSGSWGSLDITGNKGGWQGIHFKDYGYIWMVRHDGYSGMWKNGGSPVFAFNNSGSLVNGTVPWGSISGKPATFAPIIGTASNQAAAGNHTHNYMSSGGTYSTITLSDWIRTSGSSGWYSSTHGGGMHMTDSTWVRVYNNKALLCSNIIKSSNSFHVDVEGTGDIGKGFICNHKTGGMGYLVKNESSFTMINKKSNVGLSIFDNGEIKKVNLGKDQCHIVHGHEKIYNFNRANDYLHVGADTGAYGVSWWASDIKMKHEIIQLSGSTQFNIPFELKNKAKRSLKICSGLDVINRINHYSFKYNNTDFINSDGKRVVEEGSIINCGYIGQQLEEIDESLVIKVKQEKGKYLYDEKDPVIRQPDHRTLIPYITKAIQEQQVIIDSLKKEIDLLKAKTV